MRIAIDCFKLIKGEGKSIGIYNVAWSLVQNLTLGKKRINDERIQNAEVVVIGNEFNADDFKIGGIQFVQVSDYNPRNKLHCILWELFGVSILCKKIKADKIIYPRGFCSLNHSIEDIVIIHDLIPFYYNEHFPGVFNKIENAYIMNRLRFSADSASKIITISEASKKDIQKYLKVSDKKITVIHNACNAIDFHEEKNVGQKPYICAITSCLPHKNAVGIIKSYAAYFESTDEPLPLVVIGIPDTSPYDIPDSVKASIVCHKFIKDNHEMYRIIHNASVFMFLSLAEGFGLPPVEAMMLDVPVICSDRSSMPEVVGDAAILINPDNPVEVARGLKELLADHNLQERLVVSGRKNVERFSWDTRAKLYWNAIVAST